MSNIISKLGIGRKCLISFILLCSALTSENAFSRKHWCRGYTVVNYDRINRFITFEILLFHNLHAHDDLGFLDWCDFSYYDESKNFHHLMRVASKDQKGTDRKWIKMCYKKTNEKIQLFNCNTPEEGTIWLEGKEIDVDVKVVYMRYKAGKELVTTKGAFMKIKWHLIKSDRHIKSIKMSGLWKTDDESGGDIIEEFYPFDHVNSNSKTMKSTSCVLNSEISDKVKVTGETDAINVTGAATGEQIKVYTVSGVEVKSVVANDDVVYIKLPTNQIYIVKAGETRHKVAL